MNINRAVLVIGLLFLGVMGNAADLPVLVEEKFEKGMLGWEIGDPTPWKMIELPEGGKALSQFDKKSKFKPPHRSPFHMAMLKEPVVTDFVLDATMRSTVKDYGHRDLCLFFGQQDNGHFYYVHFGKKTDDHANQIFIVNGADRKKISTSTTTGTNWTDNWHKARIKRDTQSGDIQVYFDDMAKPVMTANDKTFTWGRVGIGTFDDTGDWKEVTLRGKKK